MISEFRNLYEFLSYTEFCPLCDKRLSTTTIFPSASSQVTGQRFILYSPTSGIKMLDVDLVDNSFTYDPTFPYVNPFTNHVQLQIAQQCKKYHYQYIGSAFLDLNNKSVSFVQMEKSNLHEKVDNSHFAVAVRYWPERETSVKITSNGNKTKEIIFNDINFDLSSKKKIISKLRTIQLLG